MGIGRRQVYTFTKENNNFTKLTKNNNNTSKNQ